ncbi:M23 family metallopeptidase [Teredinibacter sp. KSP-S5-2]|uniref:M23 family metallopeptidase n=1 Tax=Teredinibacter sp. KSP-S5-2 TaxID=3034506 RepID=UPI002934ADBD|nr:M23 family metallopeptidase [Teredinibacter sp. KSP-S5-2]WNO10368.1 M23 family metallopeptidase [Teredinibacter sp. KSP-S5-2]
MMETFIPTKKQRTTYSIKTALITIKAVFLLYMCIGNPAFAASNDITLQSELVQGGLIFGQAEPGATIRVLGKSVYVDAQGNFIFGLGRDVKSTLDIVVNGESKSYPVKQRQYKLQKIEGVDQKYVKPPASVQERIKNDAALVWQARQGLLKKNYFAEGFIWPAEGPVTGVYGSQRIFNGVPKRPHYGLDIAGPIGAKVVAPVSGVVTLSHNDMYYSGGTLVIDHGYGLTSTFIHLSRIHVTKGEEIKQGQLIAEIGATGRVTGPHLDWRMNWFDQRLDPYLVLPERNEAKAE